MSNQKEQVLAYVRTNGTITPKEADNTYSITRLAAVIFDLKELGHKFDTIIMKGKNKFDVPCTWAKYVYKGQEAPLKQFARSNQQNHDLVAKLLEEDN